MRKLIDCHVHTQRCGHASGEVDDYVRQAIRTGVSSIAFTEHLSLPDDLDPGRHLSMPPSELDDFLAEVERARTTFPQIHIVTGLEVDYLRGREAYTADALADAKDRENGPTVVLGSVHFIEDWAFDDPHGVAEWDHRDVDDAWREYFGLWMSAARSELFDVMAHPDLVKKFGHFPSFDTGELYAQAARTAAQANVRIEVSTAGLRKPVRELYPGKALLAAFCAAGVGATVGSDAHAPDEVGFAIDAAYDALVAAGYSSVGFPDGSGGWTEMVL